MSEKQNLLTELSRIMANNWIVNGDKQESMRSTCERDIRRIYHKSTIRELKTHIENITRL
jgi:hypothetical protein